MQTPYQVLYRQSGIPRIEGFSPEIQASYVKNGQIDVLMIALQKIWFSRVKQLP